MKSICTICAIVAKKITFAETKKQHEIFESKCLKNSVKTTYRFWDTVMIRHDPLFTFTQYKISPTCYINYPHLFSRLPWVFSFTTSRIFEFCTESLPGETIWLILTSQERSHPQWDTSLPLESPVKILMKVIHLVLTHPRDSVSLDWRTY